MAGRGPAASENRRRRNEPERGEWTAAPGVGWQHGPIPKPPSGMLKPSRETWDTWFKAWFASHWGPEQLPQVRQAIRLYDQVERGEFQRATELRLWTDTLGISPKGQQDRRWKPPEKREPEESQRPGKRYSHLRPVDTSAS